MTLNENPTIVKESPLFRIEVKNGGFLFIVKKTLPYKAFSLSFEETVEFIKLIEGAADLVK